MVLKRLKGKNVNFELIMHAIENTPSLILDCANYANPHLFYPFVNPDNFREVYVIPVDAIYRFRDTLKQAGQTAEKLRARCIVITTFDRLFSYDDPEENRNIIEHAWNIIDALSEKHEVLVGEKQRHKNSTP